VKIEINILVNTTMLVVIAVAMGATNVTALSPYQSGYNHGVGDAQKAAQGLGGND